MSDIYFPDMRRVQTEHGDYVEPALNQDWSTLMQLEWQLAVLRVDTGIIMTVQCGKFDQFSYSAAGYGSSPGYFGDCWNFIVGVSTGATLAKEQRTSPIWDRVPLTSEYEARWTQPNFAPEISSVIRDRIKTDLWTRVITDTLRYRAQDTTVLSDEPVTSYE